MGLSWGHTADWRAYAQEVEHFPAPAPHLAELLEAMHSRMLPTPPDNELACLREERRPIAQMGWKEYRAHLQREEDE